MLGFQNYYMTDLTMVFLCLRFKHFILLILMRVMLPKKVNLL